VVEGEQYIEWCDAILIPSVSAAGTSPLGESVPSVSTNRTVSTYTPVTTAQCLHMRQAIS